MKRSEAIRLIVNELEAHTDTHGDGHLRLNAEQFLHIAEKVLKMSPVKYYSSGCLHSMREMCNCQGTYDFDWDRE